MTRILIVEDNRNLADGLRYNLAHEGYVVDVAYDAPTGLARAAKAPPDLVILDLMLPGGVDGYEALRRLRAGGSEAPVLILTARGEEMDQVRGFRLGADDYVTKPFRLLELMARIEALLRRARPAARAGAPAAPPLEAGRLRIEPATRSVFRDGVEVPLRPKEFELLLALARRGGALATRQELLDEVWGYGADVVSRTVDTHVLELRRKLEDDPASPRHILTVRKGGYRLAGSSRPGERP